MSKRWKGTVRQLALAGLGLLLALGAGCTGQGSAADSGPLATRVAALEGKVSTLQTAVAQTSARLATPTRGPTPSPLPPVTGLPVDGVTKGSPAAKVTLVDYSDYL